MSKPGKLTKSVFKRGGADRAHRPPLIVEDCVLAIDRHVDGRADLTVVHGGLNMRISLSDAERRELGRMLLEPHPECKVCFAGGPAGAAGLALDNDE